ncbi:MAG: dihydroorotate dehydrogenase electron transfer subunit [Oscillospiraceae bacterium]|nr:dihydroorotate dehydrogenase electron transfer subunit [Oscillospiraceae bacterium]
MPDKYICEVVYNEQLADDVHSIKIVNKELTSQARPGQFIHIKCGNERLLRRPISISSITGAAMDVVFEVKGEGTLWLSKCEVGSPVDIIGPLGNGFTIPDGNLIVVGGGIGVPPLLFAAEAAKGVVTAILGFRNKDRVILIDAFEKECSSVHITTDDGSLGAHGAVTVPLTKLLDDNPHSAVIACGPQAMLKAVAKLCIAKDVSCQVSLEEKMGCGVGACLVCVCETSVMGTPDMSRVCVEGPVFEATDIAWGEQ